ncbi:MAG: hypothetical protein ACOYBR_09680 [Fluviibacter sp.]
MKRNLIAAGSDTVRSTANHYAFAVVNTRSRVALSYHWSRDQAYASRGRIMADLPVGVDRDANAAALVVADVREATAAEVAAARAAKRAANHARGVVAVPLIIEGTNTIHRTTRAYEAALLDADTGEVLDYFLTMTSAGHAATWTRRDVNGRVRRTTVAAMRKATPADIKRVNAAKRAAKLGA